MISLLALTVAAIVGFFILIDRVSESMDLKNRFLGFLERNKKEIAVVCLTALIVLLVVV